MIEGLVDDEDTSRERYSFKGVQLGGWLVGLFDDEKYPLATVA